MFDQMQTLLESVQESTTAVSKVILESIENGGASEADFANALQEDLDNGNLEALTIEESNAKHKRLQEEVDLECARLGIPDSERVDALAEWNAALSEAKQ